MSQLKRGSHERPQQLSIIAISLITSLLCTSFTFGSSTEQITSRQLAERICPTGDNITSYHTPDSKDEVYFEGYNNRGQEFSSSFPVSSYKEAPIHQVFLHRKVDAYGNEPGHFGKRTFDNNNNLESIVCFYHYRAFNETGDIIWEETKMAYNADATQTNNNDG